MTGAWLHPVANVIPPTRYVCLVVYVWGFLKEKNHTHFEITLYIKCQTVVFISNMIRGETLDKSRRDYKYKC